MSHAITLYITKSESHLSEWPIFISLHCQTMAIFFFFCLCLLLLVLPISSSADSHTYIVHMDSSSMPKAFSTHHNWYSSTLSEMSDGPGHLVYTYANAINGFSAVLSPSQLESIKSSPGYISSMRDTPVKVDTTHSFKFLGLDANNGAWPASDYGNDVIIGLVDTGIWPESRSFDDDGMSEIPERWKGACESGTKFKSSVCNKKLIGARYFNKGLLAKNPNLTIAMNSPRDSDGHGSHTSSTAAGGFVDGASFFGYAPGTARGMAPKARVAMYKALWDEGVFLSDIIAAIDQAIADGVDVLSLSFGIDGLPLYSDPVAIATFAAMEKGIFVSTSAGNEGPDDATLHNGTPWVLNVAAGTIDREFHATITLSNGVSATGLSLYPGNYLSTESPIVFVPSCKQNSSFKKINNKIAVCLDTNKTFDEQYYYAKNSNVAGVVIITSETDLSNYIETSIPALFLSMPEGQRILDGIKNNPNTKATFKFKQTVVGTKPAPKLASYSSRGPSQSCPNVLKPDVLAPGDLILASWPSNSRVMTVRSRSIFNEFNIISGTSMSCPHAAGVGALIKGAHPHWSPAAIRSAMMTTAYATDNTGRPIQDNGLKHGEPASPLGMGAGHIAPNRALNPGLIYDATPQDYVNLLCAMNFTANQMKAVTRSRSYGCTKPSLDLNYPSFIAYFNSKGKDSDSIVVREFQRTVTNVGDEKSIYTPEVKGLKGLSVSVWPERLEFGQKFEKRGYRVRIEGAKKIKGGVVFGSLTWVESGGKFSVRSPIVATNLAVKESLFI